MIRKLEAICFYGQEMELLPFCCYGQEECHFLNMVRKMELFDAIVRKMEMFVAVVRRMYLFEDGQEEGAF
jgi:hypothetical protein